MKRFLSVLVAAVALVACTPPPSDLSVPTEAGRFARFAFPVTPLKAYAFVRDTAETGRAQIYFVGSVNNTDGIVALWSGIAGRETRLYFRFEAQGDSATLVRVMTMPQRAPEPERLAIALTDFVEEVAFRNGLPKPQLEQDR